MGRVYNPGGFTVGNLVWAGVGWVALLAVMIAVAVADQNGSRPFAIVGAVLAGGLALATVVAVVKLRRAG